MAQHTRRTAMGSTDKEAWHAAHGQAWEDQLERTRLEKLRAANEARHRQAWADVDAMADVHQWPKTDRAYHHRG